MTLIRSIVLPGCVLVCATLTALASAGSAVAAAPGAPPAGKVLIGVAGSTRPATFKTLTGRRHTVHGIFMGWGQGVSWGKTFAGANGWLNESSTGNYRLMVHMGVKRSGTVVQTPGSIASGAGDAYLVGASRAFNDSNQFVFVRPMAEMNGHWNDYSAFNKNGTRRSASRSTAQYKRAFRRITIIMRGGSVSLMNSRLQRWGLPNVRTTAKIAPSGRVAMIWNPQGEGSPNVTGNQPKDYYPGGAFVDYVANDLYSLRSSGAHWRAQNALYNTFSSKPFIVAEWAPWGYDDPAFIKKMFDWVAAHPRTKMLVYFDGSSTNDFRLNRKPGSKAAYSAKAAAGRYACPTCGATT